MTRHLGFYNTATTRTHVRFSFSTHAAAGGNVAPNSAFEAADLRIYKATDGAALSATQRSSANGITMTSPFDSLTGVHSVDIDLTDNTDASFYASGCYYEVMLCPDETVDSQTITGIVLASFEIGRPQSDVREFGGTAGTFASGRPEVNTTHVGGTSQTAGDLKASLNTIDDFIDSEIASIITTLGTPAGASISADILTIDNLVDDLESRLGTPSNLGSGATVAANLVDIEGQTDDIGAAGAGLTAADDAILSAIAALNNLSAAQVNTEVDTALTDIHLDHLLAATYDPASKPGAADALLNELVESDAGVSRFTANALEQAPAGGSGATAQEVWEYATRTLTALDEDSTTLDLDATIRGAVGLAAADLDTQLAALPTAAENADAVWDEDATAHQTQGTFGQAIGDPVADTNTIFKAVVTDAAGATVGVDVVAVKAETASIQSDTDNIQTRLPAALVSGRMDSIASVVGAGAVDAAALAADAGTEIAAAVLAAAAADPIDSNVEQINTVPITGDGAGTPFGV